MYYMSLFILYIYFIFFECWFLYFLFEIICIYNAKLFSQSLYSFRFYWNMLLPWRGNMWRESRLCRKGRRKQLRLCLSYRLLWRRISEWNWLYRWWAQIIYSLTFDTANILSFFFNNTYSIIQNVLQKLQLANSMAILG